MADNGRCPVTISCGARSTGQHRRNGGQLLLQRVALCLRIFELKLQAGHRCPRLVQPIAIIVARGGVGRFVVNEIRVFLSQLYPPFPRRAQLIAIRGDLAFQETLRTVHFGPAAARHLVGEDSQQ
jgi:hypothetical protein